MQFKCNSCKHVFQADNKEDVCCPKCESEKVSPYVSPIRVVLPFVGVLVIALGTFFVLKSVTNNEVEQEFVDEQEEGTSARQDVVTTNPQKEVQSKNTSTITKSATEEVVFVPDEKLMIPESVVLNATTPKYVNGKYSFEASSENLPKDARVVYVLFDSMGNTKIKVSKDGKFTGIASSEDGMYKVVVMNEVTEFVLADKVVGGFVKHENVVLAKKMSKEELQRMINSKNSALMGQYKGIASHVTLKFSNLNADEKKPKIFADIFTKITMGDWESVVVTSVSYDDKNCINVVNMQVKHSDF